MAGEAEVRGKTCPNSTLSTTNPTCTDLGSNSELPKRRPMPRPMNHGTEFYIFLHLTLRMKESRKILSVLP